MLCKVQTISLNYINTVQDLISVHIVVFEL